MITVGAGARGVYVERTPSGFCYRFNPKNSASIGPWRQQAERYARIEPAAVQALLSNASSSATGTVVGVLAGLGSGLLVAAGTDAVLPGILVGGLLGVAARFVSDWSRSPLALSYDPDDGASLAFVRQLAEASTALRGAARLWGTSAIGMVQGPAGGSTAVVVTTSDLCGLPFVVSLAIPCWRVGEALLVFLPDRLVALVDKRTEFFSYDQVSVFHDTVDVMQSDAVPPDATVLASRWQHTTRSGEPDRRYRHNPVTHAVRYGQVHLHAGGRVAVTLQSSHLAAAQWATATLAAAIRAPLGYVAPMSSPASWVPPAPAVSSVPFTQPAAPYGVVAPIASAALVETRPVMPFAPPPQPPAEALRASLPAAERRPPMPPPMRTMAMGSMPDYVPSDSWPSSPVLVQRPSVHVLESRPPPPTPAPRDVRPVSSSLPPGLPLGPVHEADRFDVVEIAPASAAASTNTPYAEFIDFETPPKAPPPLVRPGPPAIPPGVPLGNARDEDAPPQMSSAVSGKVFAIPPRPPAVAPRPSARWVAPDEVVEVGSFRISGGLFYLGEQLLTHRRQTEPALVRPGLKISRAPDLDDTPIGYWPSYSSLSPERRGHYIQWLADGRRNPTTPIGYVFIFFYGLERRMFLDADRTSRDVEAMRTEVEALRTAYSGNSSFQHYSAAFLDALDSTDSATRRSSPGVVRFDGCEAPLWLRLELAWRAREQTPLDARWALAWFDTARPSPSPTVRSRCEREMELLFAARYREACGEGVVPSRGRSRLVADYRPASSSFEGPLSVKIGDLTDPTRSSTAERHLDQIGAVVQRCVDELDGYSRWLGRNPDGRGTTAALTFLPPALLASQRTEPQDRFIRQLERWTDGKPLALVPTRDLLSGLGSSPPAKLSKADAMLLVQLLERLGYGVEPDARFHGPVLSASGEAVLFRLPAGSPAVPSREYEAATLFAQLAAVMATADGEVGAEERLHVDRHIEQALQLGEGERVRLAAHLEWLLRSPPTPASIKKRLAPVPESARRSLASFLVGIAGADGRVDPGEIKVLRKLYPLLGLDADLVYSDLHAMAATSPSIAPPPLSSRRSAPPDPAPTAGVPAGGVRLDMARVQATLSQTAAVTALLGSIFTETEEARVPALSTPATAPPAVTRTVAGLDAAHSGLLLALVQRARWTRAEFEQEAARHALMPDGALEAINEKAFDRCGAALCEGDDPIDVDAEIAKELTDD